MDFPSFSYLYHAQETLATQKDSILDEWISQKQCAAILGRHSIDPKWFKSKYASAVFDYFMGVVAGEVELGQCPVMKEFIDYLKNQEIRSDELFLLCTHFKRSVINNTYRSGINTQGLFEAVSYLFDTNFSSILTLYNDTIYQKEQEAIEANKAKEYFLSNMSHEIRTPLNAILGFVNLLKSESLGERIDDYLDIIAQSGENLLHIINDILDFSKLRSGEFVIEPLPFNIQNKMRNALELFVPSAHVKSLSIDYTISPKIPHCIVADSFRIQQILGNLLSNAIKFSSPNLPIEVRVDFDPEQSMLIIEVRDFGVGISQQDQQRIFDPFYQSSEGMKQSGGGSGLGLSICNQLAKQMGGEITLESKIGWGSLFVVRLPVTITEDETCEVKASRGNIGAYYGYVLVAEDNGANQELIRMTLERYGLNVTIVDNGLDAYRYIKTNTYDFVLMDEQMPVMNGSEAVKKIRLYERENNLRHLPIIALSANVIKGARERALQHGYDAFMGKPFNISELELVLEMYLESKLSFEKPMLKDNSHVSEMERMQKALMLEPEQIKKLLELFHTNMGRMLRELRLAIEAKDFETIAGVTHTIKGSSANFRFEEFSRLAAILEESATRDQERFDFEDALSVFENEYYKLPKVEEIE
ncbi:MAG: ATP-binding protein [Sulfuricurvum sp.]|uniref:ATP-binding protein n=1 Tax=Sulfuricurvum sp. TaxID=2025608 RepID=UPI0026286CD9|nr:ATP-binding protein [Sulfuricurvum sp.]MDD2829780.1 ATP-binding protein [Sulfuricurvum sp.]MDD4948426.1 ATP-binding protein [Sulfuricurvum sp.]